MTLQELYNKVIASEELKKSFAEAAQDKEKLADWLKANDSSATIEQVAEFLKSKQTSGEVSDDELENVAGGISSGNITVDVVVSVCSGGLGCAYMAAMSATDGSAADCFE